MTEDIKLTQFLL